MSDAIEEIGRRNGEKRNEAMEAWAAMIYSDQSRRGDLAVVQESGGCGGSSVPKDTLQLTDPKKIAKLKEVKAAQEALKAEQARTRDTVQKSEPVEPTMATQAPVEGRREVARVQATRQTQETATRQVRQGEEAREQAQVAREESVQAQTAAPEVEIPATLGNSKEAGEQLSQVRSLTATSSPDQVDKTREAEPTEPVIEVDSAEQAALLAALKSGAGANPDLVAKAYVQATSMEGVKGTLQEEMLRGFVVAL